MRRHSIRTSLVSALAIAAAGASPHLFADGGDTAHWATIVGIVQAGNAVGVGAGKVLGGGQPWTALGGNASVDLSNGRVDFDVRGLVFAGGGTIGTPTPITQVRGTLVCDPDGSAGDSVLVDTPLVTLDAEGNARFHGGVGALPAACTSEADLAFLVRIPSGRWIANGAVLR